jgi:hypothetical protein
MAYHPQRFIHAANLRLDVPVSVFSFEQLTEAQRHAFEDATLHAFDQVIEACLRHNVQFLLLSGNVFVEADRSLRARLAVIRAFNRLRERGIRVFVIPGDSDPPEAWRSIPDLPDNVTVCYTSSTEPAVLEINQQPVLTISASMWLGQTDDFGIQVIAAGGDTLQPFRIGLISRARCEERQRMAALAASASDDALARTRDNPSTGELIAPVTTGGQTAPATPATAPAPGSPPTGNSVQNHATTPDRTAPVTPERPAERDPERSRPPGFIPSAAFLKFADELLQDASLDYLALTSELDRTTLHRDAGVVHCPGTTQPRSRREASAGTCSLVNISETGEVRITALDTSCVDWKIIEVEVDAGMDLSTLLQIMKTRLLELRPGTADQYWSVQWILRGDLPDLEHLRRSDLHITLAVELDELQWPGRKLQLLHDLRFLPDAWPTGSSPAALADQYQSLLERPSLLAESSLAAWIERAPELSEGWKQRLHALLPSLDREQILAKLREDGGRWFEPLYSDGIDDPEIVDSEASPESDSTAADSLEATAQLTEDEADDDSSSE